MGLKVNGVTTACAVDSRLGFGGIHGNSEDGAGIALLAARIYAPEKTLGQLVIRILHDIFLLG